MPHCKNTQTIREIAKCFDKSTEKDGKYGLTDKQRKAQSRKKRNAGNPDKARHDEYFRKECHKIQNVGKIEDRRFFASKGQKRPAPYLP